MKTLSSNVNKRKFFQLEVDKLFKQKLTDLAKMNGVSASGVVRMLVNREHAAHFNGHKPEMLPGLTEAEKVQP
jgi:hypothetical protein